MSSSTTIKDSFSKLHAFISGFRRSSDNMASNYTKENTITHPYENPDHLHDCLVSMGFEKEKIHVKAGATTGYTVLLPCLLSNGQKEEISKYFKSKKREERKNAAVEDDV
ncbi:hypothetical protein F5Y08DRAFT_168445 [Xylaria arbuscula]|nr:hypothetical protein F5Y08DRAFT_168445 [Xylaria arbuscula]